MPIHLQVRVTGEKEAMKLLERIDRNLSRETDKGLRRSVEKVGEVFQRNFQGQGNLVGGWKPLAEATQQRRKELGFPASAPILVRYGALRGVVADDLAAGKMRSRRTDNYSGSVIEGTVEITRDLAILSAKGPKTYNQTGAPRANLPARPFWFANRHSAKAAGEGLVMWIEDEVIKG